MTLSDICNALFGTLSLDVRSALMLSQCSQECHECVQRDIHMLYNNDKALPIFQVLHIIDRTPTKDNAQHLYTNFTLDILYDLIDSPGFYTNYVIHSTVAKLCMAMTAPPRNSSYMSIACDVYAILRRVTKDCCTIIETLHIADDKRSICSLWLTLVRRLLAYCKKRRQLWVCLVDIGAPQFWSSCLHHVERLRREVHAREDISVNLVQEIRTARRYLGMLAQCKDL